VSLASARFSAGSFVGNSKASNGTPTFSPMQNTPTTGHDVALLIDNALRTFRMTRISSPIEALDGKGYWPSAECLARG
jgi:hypothetical protein